MSKKRALISIGIIIAFIIIVSNDVKPIDWTATYDETNTNPLDTKIFFQEMPSWFNDEPIKKIHISFYEYSQINELDIGHYENNYISISDEYVIDPSSFDSLLEFIANGNYAFISARNFPDYVKDTLQFDVDLKPLDFDVQNPSQRLHLNFNNDSLLYTSKLQKNITYFKDTLAHKKIGYNQLKNGEKLINFIGIPFQNGVFYLHTNPEVFTNYQLLETANTDYISTVISFLPKGPVFFNRIQKYDPELSRSPLRFIFSKAPLKWAWISILFGIAFFMYFNGKRRQRIIPIIPEIKNTTTEFVKTVSNLFFESEDYNSIIHKKINYFLEYIRSHYHLSTDKLNKEFVKKLALKSNNSEADIQSLITMISNMKDNHYKTKLPLINLSKKIENFYKRQ